MSEYGEGDDNLDGTTAAASSADNSANNSILGKVRTGVTNILPQSLSKWFSPSSNKSDTIGSGTKRRHYETENSMTPTIARRRIGVYNQPENEDDEEADDLDEEEGVVESNALSSSVQTRRSLNVSSNDELPPLKRSRMSFEGSMLNSRPLVASTPAIGTQRNPIIATNHYGRLNLPHGRNKREPAYNFFSTTTGTTGFETQNVTPDIIDLIPIPISSVNRESESNNEQLTSIEPARSRRSLNINPTTTSSFIHTSSNSALPTLKRQSLCSVKDKSNSTTTATRQTVENNNILPTIMNFEQKNEPILLDTALELDEVVLQSQSYNGQAQPTFQNGNNDDFDDELQQRSSAASDSEAEETDTSNPITNLPIKRSRLAAGTLKAVLTNEQTLHNNNKPTPGLYNMSLLSKNSSRNGSRNSLQFGNGLNFDTHLEGRKSLFSRSNTTSRQNVNNTLSNSTLSLNSLSRRQFNASIYGSTSALSDSRLLNTTSPFYKGNTTYGGASAYSKYTVGNSNRTIVGGTSRLTPTIIRPTSSLSTLSSSNNSITGGVLPSTHLSLTSKTLLDTINELTTPISEAKKMANNLQRQQAAGKNNRLSEADIQAARAIRLQQVTKPYARPTVMLRPKDAASTTSTTLPPPPIRELQVPSMTQLLAMKRHNQNVTAISRQITMQTEDCQNYAINKQKQQQQGKTTTKIGEQKQQTNVFNMKTSTAVDNGQEKKNSLNEIKATPMEDFKQQPQQQQKHINKMRHKINNTRNTIPDFIEIEPSLLPADLPKINFPAMKEMPKFDIGLPSPKTNTINTPSPTTTTPMVISQLAAIHQLKSTFSLTPTTPTTTTNLAFQFSPPIDLNNTNLNATNLKPAAIHFDFSAPVSLKSTTNNTLNSPAASTMTTIKTPQGIIPILVPALKTGSCLDALKKNPLELLPTKSVTFGDQFKKAADEWECDACMLRNKETAQKCVACETSRSAPTKMPTTSNINTTTITTTSPTSGFGDLFKKQTGEWECDACMVRNKSEAQKCISCETSRKTAKTTNQCSTNSKTGFGDLFKTKSGEWECDACMVRNKPEAIKCISCETARKNATTPTTTSGTTTAFKPPDSGFKAIAQAQASNSWECEVCATRNDAGRGKCICCEQAKPGNSNTPQDSTAPKFNFGTTSASKFNFGFGGANKESELRTTTSTAAATTFMSNAKTEASKGFIFNNATSSTVVSSSTSTITTTKPSNGFTFGFPAAVTTTKAATTTTATTVTATSTTTDVADAAAAAGATKSSGFVFGQLKATTNISTITTSSSPKAALTQIPTSTTSSDLNKQTTTIVTTTITATTPLTFTGFNSSPKAITSTSSSTLSSSSNSLSNNKTDFSFGLLNKPKTTETTNSSCLNNPTTTVTNATSTMPAFGQQAAFTFGMKAPPPPSTTTTTPVATTIQTNQKPLLAFGLTTAATTSVPSSTGVVTTTASAAPTFGSGFQFGNLANSSNTSTTATSTTKSLFGIATAPTNTTVATFGAFATSKLGNSQNENSTNIQPASSTTNATITTQTTSTTITASSTSSVPFGGFNFGGATANAKTENNNNNLFGSIANQQQQPKPIASATPMFGNLTSSNSTTTSTTSAWPNNNNNSSSTLLFGNMNTTNETAPKLQAFGTAAPTSNATSATSSQSIFGTTSAPTPGQPPAFGSNKIAPIAVFGSTSTGTSTPNLFGNNNNNAGNNNNSGSLPQFGSVSNNNASNIGTPAFGSSSSTSGVTFGGFNATTTNQDNVNTNSQSNAATPFQFGGAQNTNSGGFNFGGPAAGRPAFNFTATNSQPSFNFTGGSTENNQNTARPFQFGAPAAPTAAPQIPTFNNNPTSMVFNFGSAPTTTETNTPFQFNAGNAAPPANNIFAPQPSASNTAQSSAAARRRVRVPTRRLPPR